MSNRQQRRNPTKRQLASAINQTSSQMAQRLISLENRLVSMEQAVDVVTDAVLGGLSGEAKAGDTVVIGFLGTIDGVPFQGGSSESFVLENLGGGEMVSGFEENVIGMKPSERKEFTLTFPDTYRPELAGKLAKFSVYLIAVVQTNQTVLLARNEIQSAQTGATNA